ncbi:MAG: AGE family epimerase/isomerase [Cyclobacteriaceae bacterium]
MIPNLKRYFPSIACIFLVHIVVSCGPQSQELETQTPDEAKLELANQMEEVLKQHSLDPWYPQILDTINGGFWSDFDHTWEKEGPQQRMMVTQARHVWTASKAAERYPKEGRYPEVALHGFKFLKEVMWDSEKGGFFHLVDSLGSVVPDQEGNEVKLAYDNAFGVYALAAYYKLSQKQEVLNLAKEAFNWMEKKSHDDIHGGYFQFMQKDGTPITDGLYSTPPKDQNSSIHLLEAWTELYAVWPDELLKKRLSELYDIISDTITGDKHYMYLFFNADWTPVLYRDSLPEVREAHYNIDHVSFGHDIETAFLLWEAAEALHLDEVEVKPKLKAMVDQAINKGWDPEFRGLFDQGYYFPEEDHLTIIDIGKAWWAQAEAMNTLLIWSDWYPEDSLRYFDRFEQQWNYIQSYLLDKENKGWYVKGIDQEPKENESPKAGIWKGNYHDYRSLANCIDRLRQK